MRMTQTGSFFWRLLSKVLERGVKKGCLEFKLPDGSTEVFGRSSPEEANSHQEPVCSITINDWDVCLKLIRNSDVALGEAYMSEEIDCTEDDLLDLLRILISNSKELYSTIDNNNVQAIIYKLGNFLLSLKHAWNKNTVAGSRRNIEAHYDLGNDMYKLFLDDTMTYSSGIHGSLDEPTSRENLLRAQEAKLDNIVKKLDVQDNDWILEIGCGWGSFAKRATETKNCKVVGITISVEQLEYARKMLAENGLENKACLILCDYRKLGTAAVCEYPLEFYGSSEFASQVYEKLTTPGSFDKVASIEMIEAVGDEHLDEYFGVINRMLKVNGRTCLQAISVKDENYESYLQTSDFIRAHIFPGGCLVSLKRMKEATEAMGNDLAVNLDLTQDIGPDYATTLRMWRNLFVDNLETIRGQGYPEAFIRKWVFYFIYCEAAFELKYIHDFQVLFVKHPSVEKVAQVEGGAFHSSAVLGKPSWQLESTVFPALLYFSGFLANESNIQDIGYIGMCSAMFSLLLILVFADKNPNGYNLFQALPNIVLCAAYLLSPLEVLPRFVAFTVFAKSAINVNRSPEELLPVFMRTAAFVGALYSSPGSAILLGLGETFEFLSTLPQVNLSLITKVPVTELGVCQAKLVGVAACYLLPVFYTCVSKELGFLATPYVVQQLASSIKVAKEAYEQYENMFNTNELIKNPAFKQKKEVLIQNMLK